MELICPAGTEAAFHAAVEAGADAVYCGFADETNARNFPGLNFTRPALGAAISFAHRHGTQVYVTLNTYPTAGREKLWQRAVDDAVALGADALILADIGLLTYAARAHPGVRRHLSVQAAAASVPAISYYVEEFGIRRVVLPRVLTLEEVRRIAAGVRCEVEVFVFGGLCVMEEGRCALSSYATGRSPNLDGVCSPAEAVSYEKKADGSLVCRVGGVMVNRLGADEAAPYPTLCKGRFRAGGEASYLFESPTSLDATALLAAFREAGVHALKIEGRQRGRAYVGAIVGAFRRALAELDAGRRPAPITAALAEGGRGTEGAYRKGWR
jgi:collagenase-like PrtC family protease